VGDSSGLGGLVGSCVRGAGGRVISECGTPFSVGGLEEGLEPPTRSTRVTGGGLHRSYTGSPEAPSSCLIFVGARIAVVTMAECASNTSTGRLSCSLSTVMVGQMYAFRSSLPHITYRPSSLKVAWIWLHVFSFPRNLTSRFRSLKLYSRTRESLLVIRSLTSPFGSLGGNVMVSIPVILLPLAFRPRADLTCICVYGFSPSVS
jgi:hypothetical protein